MSRHPTPPPRLGLVGCGRIAELTHLPALRALETGRLVAAADPDPARRRLAERYGVRTVGDPTDLLDDVDAVVITTPTHTHADLAVAAFEAGCHVYVEKPLAPHVGAGRRIADAWESSGRVGMVGFNLRYQPLTLEARRRIAAGDLGEVVGVRTAFCSAPRDLPAWKRTRATGGGALLDLASHHVDLVRFLLGREIEHAEARTRTVRTEDDVATLDLVLDGGVPVQTLVSLAATPQDRVEIVGDAGTLVIDRFRSRTLRFTPAHLDGDRRSRLRRTAALLARVPGDLRDALLPIAEPSFATALRTFALAAANGIQPAPSIADGLAALEVIERAEAARR